MKPQENKVSRPTVGLVTLGTVCLAILTFTFALQDSEVTRVTNLSVNAPLYWMVLIIATVVGLSVSIMRREPVRYGVLAICVAILLPPIILVWTILVGFSNL